MKLIRTGLFAALLVAVAAVPASANSITFSSPGTNQLGWTNFFGTTAPNYKYQFAITFDDITHAGDLDVTAAEVSSIPGVNCVPIAGPGACVIFTATPVNGLTFTGFYTIDIKWLYDTDPLYPNTAANFIRLIHDHGNDREDITINGSYCLPTITGCNLYGGNGDAGISGKDDNFSNFEVTSTQVTPEPGTLVLLGSGIAALIARYRRKR